MATERPVLIDNNVAGADFSAGGALAAQGYQNSGQFLIVKANPNGVDLSVVPCTSHRDRPRGIIQNNPPIGSAAAVMSSGISKVVAGGTLVAGEEFGTNNLGQAVKKNATSTGADYGDFVMGEVREGGAAGDLVDVIFYSPYRI